MSETVKIILGSIGGTFFLGLFTFLGIVVRERNKTKRRKFELKHQTLNKTTIRLMAQKILFLEKKIKK
ncbi:hypothetical protein [Spiroplasma endosymbiont of Ammophila pubescens]|uniref:hypothetical protein n=1 Tax=Spiroplasma endosymbiont of Ammophila pubescens TaxID=3066315 RepID=UPI0032B2E54B